jgi:formate--tetrahydrofolate ligase
MKTDIQISRAATLRPIAEIAAVPGFPESAVEPYGRAKAKIDTLAESPCGAGEIPWTSMCAG